MHKRAVDALLVTCSALGLTGCNAGLAGLFEASSTGDSPDVQSVASALSAPRSATSPATISFELSDQEGDFVTVALSFDRGDGFQPITLAEGSSLGPFPTNSGGPILVEWDFETDLGGTGYVEDLALQLQVAGGISPSVLTGVSQGNDAPVIGEVSPSPPELEEFGGNTDLLFEATDSAQDAFQIAVEFNPDEAGGFPEEGWRPARPAATSGTEPTPLLVTPELLAGGDRYSFRWDTLFDLAGFDGRVRVRLRPEDSFAQGELTEFELSIDNNAEPFSIIDEVDFVTNPDQRRGIPVLFSLVDDESDPIQVVLQWRLAEQEDFPDLPGSAEELIDLAQNPEREAERLQAQIGRQMPVPYSGSIGVMQEPLAADEVRLPELAGENIGLLAYGLAGRTLQALRPALPAAAPWATKSPLTPVDVLALEDGVHALVLESARSGWTIRRVNLTTGAAESLSSGPGVPKAMAGDLRSGRLVVATDTSILQIAMSNGALLGSRTHSIVDGPRDVALIGTDTVLISGDDSLTRLDLAAADGTEVLLLDSLVEPWGIVADPVQSGRVFVADRRADRVLALELDRLVLEEVVAKVSTQDTADLGSIPLPSPRGLDIGADGTSLLVMCELGGASSVRALTLHSASDLDLDGQADPEVFEYATGLGATDARLAFGPEGLVLLCLPETLALGGGVAQARTIVPEALGAYDPATQVVRVESPFDPPLTPPCTWRIREPLITRGKSSPGGTQNTYVWDSSELPDAADVRVRILPVDRDLGLVAPLSGLRPVRGRLEFQVESLAEESLAGASPLAVTVADLDGDGDLDIVVAVRPEAGQGDLLRVLYQTEPGEFTLDPDFAFSSMEVRGVQDIAVADLDRDGDMDFVTANRSSNNITIFRQTAPGEFSLDPQDLLGLVDRIIISAAPVQIEAVDVDGDSDVDLVVGLRDRGVAVLLQDSPGQFQDSPNGLLERDVVTFINGPRSMAVADLDQDGDLDIVAGYQSPAELAIFTQTEPGQFLLSPSGPRIPEGVTDPVDVVVADIDGDGDNDLLSRNAPGSLVFYYQAGPGEFVNEPSGVFNLEIGAGVIGAPALADMDRDGDLDVITRDGVSGDIWIPQVEPGEFALEQARSLDLGGALNPIVRDLDGDGDTDFLNGLGGPLLNPLVAGSQVSSGEFGSEPSATTNFLSTDLRAGDLDGDGDLDLMVRTADAGLALLFQFAPGRFTAMPQEVLLPELALVDTPPIDLDGDGDLDMIAFSSGDYDSETGFVKDPARAHVVLQTSPGQFAVDEEATLEFPLGFLPGGSLSRSALGDLDGDGDPDLVVVDVLSGQIARYDQTQPLRFELSSQGPILESSRLSPNGLQLVDLDGDGDLDLLTRTGFADLQLHFQSGAGQFTPDPNGILSAPFSLISAAVLVRDMDGDADLDLVTSSDDGYLNLLIQGAPGQFSRERMIPLDVSNLLLVGVSVADFNLDGALDVAVGEYFVDSQLRLFAQSHPGRLVPQRATPADLSVSNQEVPTGDFNGDGEPDIISRTTPLTFLFGGQ